MQRRTRRALIWLTLIFGVGVAAIIVIGMAASRRDSAAARRMREHGQAAVARYEAQFGGDNAPVEPPPGGSAESDAPSAPTSAEDEERSSASPAAFILFEKLRQEVESLESEEDQDLQELLKKDWSEWTEDDFRRLSEFLGPHEDLLDEIRRLARLGKPVYRVDLSKGYVTELPHPPPLRNMARLLSRDAAVRIHAGDLDGAMEDYRAIIGLSETLVEEPIIISQLVRFAMTGIMFESVGSLLPPGQVSPGEARAFVEETAELYHREALVNAFLTEGAFGIDIMDRLRDGTSYFDPSGSSPPEVRGVLGLLYRTPIIGGVILDADQGNFAEYIERLSEAAENPYYGSATELEAIEAETQDLSFLSHNTQIIVPALTRVQIAQARNEAQIDLMRMGLSLEAYYAETGSYPESLNAIAGDLGGTVPVDPFTGESYVYRPEGGAFTLYSVGQNQQDDGGRFDYREGDIVWRGIKEKK